MSTIKQAIQKQRKLNHEFNFRLDSIEIHSNESFFEEERSSINYESDTSEQEDIQDYQQMDSICIHNSISSSKKQEKCSSVRSRNDPSLTTVRGNIVQEMCFDSQGFINNKNSQTGKGIAIHVLGQGSIGKQSKKGKKIEKSNKKKLQNLNNQININNNSQDQQLQQSSSSNMDSHSQLDQQSNKQINQSQKVILAYLMLENDVQKQALERAQNFIDKFMPNVNNKELLINIQETYKILLLPDQILPQLAQVLSQEERLQYLNLSLHRLNLANNMHPLAAKAADKIGKNFNYNC